MNDSLPNYFVPLNIFFSLSLHFLLLHSFFHCFACQAKEITQFHKKTGENKFENKSKNALCAGQFNFNKRRTK